MNAERTCDAVQADLSARLDGQPGVASDALDEHLAHCAECRAFDADARALRQALRYSTVDSVPDVAGVVTARLAAEPPADTPRQTGARRRRLLAAAAVFLVGALVGALVVSDDGTEPGPSAAASVPAQVDAAQYQLEGLEAELTLVEHGWNKAVSERRWTGSLTWSSPELLALELRDETDYPSGDWVADDVLLAADGNARLTVGPRDCPAEAQPRCTPTEPDRQLTVDREPFADDAPVPLDLVLPVASFAGAADPESLGRRTIAGRSAVGLVTTAAQLQPVLDGLRPAGNLRQVHPSDPVELWLDDETMTPLALTVRASDAEGRIAWAANRRYTEEPGDTILELAVDRVRYGPTEPDVSPLDGANDSPEAARAAFADGAVPTLLTAAQVPLGFVLHRTGTLKGDGPTVDVASWTDGRAWIKVRSTNDWTGDRLFGGLGSFVRPVDLASGGVAYVNDRGDRVGVHTPFLDIVVTGSVDESILLSVASSLGLEGQPVPDDWHEYATSTADEARAAQPGLLLPSRLSGFAPPAFRVEDGAVLARFAGPGNRSFTLVQAPGERLSPPLDLSVTGVEVRDTEGRWSDDRQELEWVEDGRVVGLQSTTLSLNELLTVAAALEAT